MREVNVPAKVCSVEGCEAAAWSRGWCSKHLQRWRKYGDPTATPRFDVERQRREREAFFWANVEKRGDDECWPWQRKLSRGYGQMRGLGRPIGAHRFAYELLVGSVPEGMEIDHRCHTDDPTCDLKLDCPHRRCCNPAHMEVVTKDENLRRSDRSRPNNGGRKTA